MGSVQAQCIPLRALLYGRCDLHRLWTALLLLFASPCAYAHTFGAEEAYYYNSPGAAQTACVASMNAHEQVGFCDQAFITLQVDPSFAQGCGASGGTFWRYHHNQPQIHLFWFCENGSWCPDDQTWNEQTQQCEPQCTPPAKRDGQKCIMECPVAPLSEDYKQDACAASLEEGLGKDVRRACPDLSPKMQQEVQCLASKIQFLNISYAGSSSAYRTLGYQAHLREVWSKFLELEEVKDPAVKQACAAVFAQVKVEMDKHGLDYEPAEDGAHSSGEAIDISRRTVND